MYGEQRDSSLLWHIPSSQSSALGGMQNDDPSVERSFLGGGKSTVQWVEGWPGLVKAKVPRLLWLPPLPTKPAGIGEKLPPKS